MEVVRISAEEAQTVAPLFDAYRAFYGRPSDPELALSFLKERLRRGESVVFMAREGSEAVGFTQLYPSYSSVSASPIWILNDLYVTPATRRGGAGRALLGHAREFARGTGATKLVLATAPDNEPAQKLYEAAGWERDPFFHYYVEA